MEENQGQEKKKILSVCCWGLAAFISVAFFFTMDLWRSEASDEAETLKDKVDSTVLPESKGENHLAGKIFSFRRRCSSVREHYNLCKPIYDYVNYYKIM